MLRAPAFAACAPLRAVRAAPAVCAARRAPPRAPPAACAPRPPRSKIGLARALARGRVASTETVGLLLRAGLVAVNGVVAAEASARVDLEEDVITVRGEVVDCRGELGAGGEGAEEERSLTRAQRDFRKGKFGEAGRAEKSKKYSRFVDGGFYSGKKWTAGK